MLIERAILLYKIIKVCLYQVELVLGASDAFVGGREPSGDCTPDTACRDSGREGEGLFSEQLSFASN